MLADNFLRCDSAGSCMMGDQLNIAPGKRVHGKYVLPKTVEKFDDYSLTCDSAGNCMLADSLATKDNAGFNVSVPGMGKIGANWADNSLRADSSGNVMMGDQLVFGGVSIGPKGGWLGKRLADNSLICDSAGNCTFAPNFGGNVMMGD